MDTSTEDLDESMLDVIERAEAFLTAHSTILGQTPEFQDESTSNVFSSGDYEPHMYGNMTGNNSSDSASSMNTTRSRRNRSTTGESSRSSNRESRGSTISSSQLSIMSMNSTSHSLGSGSVMSNTSISNESAGELSTSRLSSSNNSRPSRQLSESGGNDSSGSNDTEPYEINADIVQSLGINDSLNDDCIVVAASAPPVVATIDLCSPQHEVDFLSPRRPRNRRRRLDVPAYIVDCITLDDTIAADQQIVTQPDVSQSSPPKLQRNIASDSNSTQKSEGDVPAKSFTCPICLDSIVRKKASSTICGHLFCYACIMHEVQIRKKCPLCKRKILRSQVHPIYFN